MDSDYKIAAPLRPLLFLFLFAWSCESTPQLASEVERVLARDAGSTSTAGPLTGTWSTDDGELLSLVQAVNAVAVLPQGEGLRALLHFAEGRLSNGELELVGYRQGVKSDTSAAGLDVGAVRTATVDVRHGTITWADGRRWIRRGGSPGNEARTGTWRSESGLVAVAEEGGYVLLLPLDVGARRDFDVGYGKRGADRRLRTIFVTKARVRTRDIGRDGTEPGVLDWSGRGRWYFEAELLGAPPAPPSPVAPAADAVLPNAVDDTLRWEFDWDDVPGASEYRIEVSLVSARHPFIDAGGLKESRYVHAATGGFITRTDGWSWRVAARVGSQWTDWSERVRFRVSD